MSVNIFQFSGCKTLEKTFKENLYNTFTGGVRKGLACLRGGVKILDSAVKQGFGLKVVFKFFQSCNCMIFYKLFLIVCLHF